MTIDRSDIIRTLRTRGDDEQVRRAEADLPEQVDVEQHRDLLASLGLGADDLASLGADTGLGSGQGSGLGINLQSEPEDPLDPLG